MHRVFIRNQQKHSISKKPKLIVYNVQKQWIYNFSLIKFEQYY